MDSLTLELKLGLQRARLNPIRKMANWIENEMIIPDGPYEGEPFRWETQPVAKLLVDEIDSGRWNEIVITGPSQSGKTLVGFVAPVLYHTLELGEKYVLGIPDMRMANNKWQLDLLPVIEGNQRLSRLLPKSGPGSQGGIVKDTITFQNGGLIKFMSTGGSDQQRAGFTARIVGVTEAARFSRVSETSLEADPLRQMRARQASYDEPNRLLYVEGTVTVKEDLPWSMRADSTVTIIRSQCPHCGVWIAPERENLVGWENAANAFEARETARWCCDQCGEAISDDERRESVKNSRLVHSGQEITRRGEVVGPIPKTSRLFFRYSAWHNLFVTTATLGKELWQADQIDHESIEFEHAQKEISQFKFCVPYQSNNLEVQPLEGRDILRKRRDSFAKGLLPANTTHLTLGCDVGKYTLHYFALAGLADGTLHVPDYGLIEVPSQFLDWEFAISQALNELFDLVETGWIVKGTDNAFRPQQVWIDTGHEPDAIFKATLNRFGNIRRQSVVQMSLGRGSGQMQRIYQAPPKKGNGILEIGHHWHLARNKRWRCCQIFVDSDHWKDRLQDSWKQPKDQPGSVSLYHAPDREHMRLTKHMTNEHRTVEFVPGKGEVVKFTKKGANHWFDAGYNARAALDRVGWRPEPVKQI